MNRLVSLIAAFSVLNIALPANGHLEAVVDIEVKGLVVNSLRAIIVPDGQEPYLMDDLDGQLHMQMELGSTYLIEFQHAGCVSKQLLFDTRVPDGRTEPTFRTSLVLEMLPPGQDFEYLGPVGYILFDGGTDGFVFHTDYAQFGSEVLRSRMDDAKLKYPAKDIPVIIAQEINEETPSEYGVLVRTSKPSPPMVHITGKRVRDQIHHPMSGYTFASNADGQEPEGYIELSSANVGSIRQVKYASKLRIIEDVHVRNQGREKLYRKVVHRYGSTHYFCLGQSCTEEEYLKGISK